jgi:hypothetical protein
MDMAHGGGHQSTGEVIHEVKELFLHGIALSK